MKAILIATGHENSRTKTNQRDFYHKPAMLMHLLDRPFLQHVIELVAQQPIDRIELILHHCADEVASIVGEGVRWGVQIQRHLVRDADRPYTLLPNLVMQGEMVWLVHADRLPSLVSLPQLDELGAQILQENNQCWAGWARIPGEWLRGVDPEWNREQLHGYLCHCAGAIETGAAIRPAPGLLYGGCPADLIESQRRVLEEGRPGLLVAGRQVEPGIWIGRNVRIDPRAHITGPVYLGTGSKIGAGVQVGPNAVLAGNILIDRQSVVVDSLVMPGSYVGEALNLNSVVVDRNRLINVREGGEILVKDDFILGMLAPASLRTRISGLTNRLAALLLLTVCWPILLATALLLRIRRAGLVWVTTPFIQLPTETDRFQWRHYTLWSFISPDTPRSPLAHLLLHILPGLLCVVRGRLALVGVTPRTAVEISALSPDWAALYVRTKAGLLSEAFVLYGSAPHRDELYTSEAWYSVASNWHTDLRIAARFLVLLVQGRRSSSSSDDLSVFDAPSV